MSNSGTSTKKSTLQKVLENKRAVAYCLYACLPHLMFGFSLGILLPLPAFRKQFGHKYKGAYVVPAVYQSVWNCLLLPGGILGALLAGPISNRLGRKYMFIISSVVYAAGTLGQNLAHDWKDMSAAKFITYMGQASYFVASPTYISEIAPPEIRGMMLAQISTFLLIGEFITSCILRRTQHLNGNWSYHVPMILQFIIPVIMFIFTWFIPESPFWLIERGKTDAARASLERLHGGKQDLDQRLQDIKNATDQQQLGSNITYVDCFKGSNLRRTIISGGIIAAQELTGTIFIFSYTTYFFTLSGVKQNDAFTMTSILFALQLVANIVSWYLIEKFGRRTLILTGTTAMLISHFIIAGIGTSHNYKHGALPKAVVSFMVILSIAYRLSLGSAAWAVSGEVSSPALRASTESIAVISNAVSAFAIFFTIPYLINPDSANLGPKVCFLYGGLTLICIVFIYFTVPEMKGRTYEELDYMFQHRVPTRKFKDFLVPAGEVTQVSSNDEKSPHLEEGSL